MFLLFWASWLVGWLFNFLLTFVVVAAVFLVSAIVVCVVGLGILFEDASGSGGVEVSGERDHGVGTAHASRNLEAPEIAITLQGIW